MTLVPGAEEMVLDIYRNRSKSGKLNNQLGEGWAHFLVCSWGVASKCWAVIVRLESGVQGVPVGRCVFLSSLMPRGIGKKRLLFVWNGR